MNMEYHINKFRMDPTPIKLAQVRELMIFSFLFIICLVEA